VIIAMAHTARPFVLLEANYRQLLDYKPNVAVLPWGASEAHNYHLPHGTDVFESYETAVRAAEIAHGRGGRPIVLPAIPFGNNEQQLDQVATISITTATAHAILRDVVRSLGRQGIDRLLIVNAHGGNELKPIVRDVMSEMKALIAIANFWVMRPYADDPACATKGDHANEMETSYMLHLHPELVDMSAAGPGKRVGFEVEGLNQPGVWTPRPWKQSHPDTGSGDPSHGSAGKGKAFFDACSEAVAEVIVGLSKAQKGQLPYV
jgi:creatinine amidohydrolase